MGNGNSVNGAPVNSSALFEVNEPTFVARLTDTDGDIAIVLSGTADVVAQPHLEGLFRQVDLAALGIQAKRVRLDIRDLVFMSSSCFKQVVLWVQRILNLQVDARYQVVFLSALAQAWQARSLKTLTHFAQDVVRVEKS
jgi:hypothetical protein